MEESLLWVLGYSLFLLLIESIFRRIAVSIKEFSIFAKINGHKEKCTVNTNAKAFENKYEKGRIGIQ
jgi:hypothetical protein